MPFWKYFGLAALPLVAGLIIAALATMAFAADGATWSGVGGWVRGPAAIEKDMADSLQELELAWTPITSRMGPTGNVGFTIGQFTAIDRKSAAAVLHGSYITIWKQQTDGSWKVVIDSGRPAHSAVK